VFAYRLLHLGVAVILLGCLIAPPRAAGTAVREPVGAGRFYTPSRQEQDPMVRGLIAAAHQEAAGRPPRQGLRALIMPHAGYLYSGATAAHAALAIPPDRFQRVVLLGPDHRVGFRNASLTAASRWRTPLGDVPIGDCRRMADQWPDLFATVAASDRQEHSLEVILPFLQVRLSYFELIPLVLGPCDAKQMARALAPLLEDASTLLVVSADLSHYLPAAEAVNRDRQTLERILALDPNWSQDQDNRTCGRFPVGVLLELARNHQWRPVVLHTSNSGDATGDKQAVVGYAAVAFYGDESMHKQNENSQSLTPRQGAVLVTLARQTLARHFGRQIDPAEARTLETSLEGQALQARCGTFVTLKIDNQLRGCIGSLTASAPLVTEVRDNALNAALHDPRFSPLSQKELDQVQIEVSVLTEPVVLEYRDGDDLLAKLKPGIDGVILKKGYASATFLPQVWDQLPQPEQFLAHLCMKAGMSAGQWRKGDLEVKVYQVQYFEETR
jgi:AmmeMemoRadiSam system protein B/AmmeMemoRadiSam system protein A